MHIFKLSKIIDSFPRHHFQEEQKQGSQIQPFNPRFFFRSTTTPPPGTTVLASPFIHSAHCPWVKGHVTSFFCPLGEISVEISVHPLCCLSMAFRKVAGAENSESEKKESWWGKGCEQALQLRSLGPGDGLRCVFSFFELYCFPHPSPHLSPATVLFVPLPRHHPPPRDFFRHL